MEQATIDRYQAGGDIYATLAAQYGAAAADQIAAAAATGDRAQLSDAIELARGNGPARETSTLSIFGNQLATDPLAAPLDSLNNQLGKAFWNVLKNPFVLLLAIAAVAYGLYRAGFIKPKK